MRENTRVDLVRARKNASGRIFDVITIVTIFSLLSTFGSAASVSVDGDNSASILHDFDVAAPLKSQHAVLQHALDALDVLKGSWNMPVAWLHKHGMPSWAMRTQQRLLVERVARDKVQPSGNAVHIDGVATLAGQEVRINMHLAPSGVVSFKASSAGGGIALLQTLGGPRMLNKKVEAVLSTSKSTRVDLSMRLDGHGTVEALDVRLAGGMKVHGLPADLTCQQGKACTVELNSAHTIETAQLRITLAQGVRLSVHQDTAQLTSSSGSATLSAVGAAQKTLPEAKLTLRAAARCPQTSSVCLAARADKPEFGAPHLDVVHLDVVVNVPPTGTGASFDLRGVAQVHSEASRFPFVLLMTPAGLSMRSTGRANKKAVAADLVAREAMPQAGADAMLGFTKPTGMAMDTHTGVEVVYHPGTTELSAVNRTLTALAGLTFRFTASQTDNTLLPKLSSAFGFRSTAAVDFTVWVNFAPKSKDVVFVASMAETSLANVALVKGCGGLLDVDSIAYVIGRSAEDVKATGLFASGNPPQQTLAKADPGRPYQGFHGVVVHARTFTATTSVGGWFAGGVPLAGDNNVLDLSASSMHTAEKHVSVWGVPFVQLHSPNGKLKLRTVDTGARLQSLTQCGPASMDTRAGKASASLCITMDEPCTPQQSYTLAGKQITVGKRVLVGALQAKIKVNIQSTNSLPKRPPVHVVATAQNIKLTNLVAFAIGKAGADLPKGVPDVELTTVQITWDSTTGAAAVNAAAKVTVSYDWVVSSSLSIDVVRANKTAKPVVTLGIGASLKVSNDLNLKKISLKFSRPPGKPTWTVWGSAVLQVMQVELNANLTVTMPRNRKAAGAAVVYDFVVAGKNLRLLNIPETLVVTGDRISVKYTQPLKSKSGGKRAKGDWSVSGWATLDLQLLKTKLPISVSIESANKGTEQRFVLECRKDAAGKSQCQPISFPIMPDGVFKPTPKMELGFDHVTVSRTKADGFALIVQGYTAITGTKGWIKRLLPVKLVMTGSLKKSGLEFKVTPQDGFLEVDIPDIPMGTTSLPIGKVALSIVEGKISLTKQGRKTRFGFSVTVGLGLPSKMNYVFTVERSDGKSPMDYSGCCTPGQTWCKDGAVTCKPIFAPVRTFTGKADSLLQLQVGLNQVDGFFIKPLTSPFSFVQPFTAEDGSEWLRVHVKNLFDVRFQNPVLSVDVKTMKLVAKGGLWLKDLSVPTYLLKDILRQALKLQQHEDAGLIDQIPDKVPLLEFDLTKNTDNFGAALLDLVQMIGQRINPAFQVPKPLKDACDTVLKRVSLSQMPKRIQHYLKIEVPNRVQFDIAFGVVDTSLIFDVHLKDRPLKVIFPNEMGGLLGLTLRHVGIGEVLWGQALLSRTSLDFDMFMLPEIIPSYMFHFKPSKDLKSSECQRPFPHPGCWSLTATNQQYTLEMDDLWIFWLYQAAFPIPIPAFHKRIDIWEVHMFDYGGRTGTEFPLPTVDPAALLQVAPALIRFFTDRKALMPEKLPGQIGFKAAIRNTYWRLPNFLGPYQLMQQPGDNGPLLSLDTYQLVAKVANTLKRMSVSGLVQMVPLRLRTAMIPFQFLQWDLGRATFAALNVKEFLEMAAGKLEHTGAFWDEFQKLPVDQRIRLLNAVPDAEGASESAKEWGTVIMALGRFEIPSVAKFDVQLGIGAMATKGFEAGAGFRLYGRLGNPKAPFHLEALAEGASKVRLVKDKPVLLRTQGLLRVTMGKRVVVYGSVLASNVEGLHIEGQVHLFDYERLGLDIRGQVEGRLDKKQFFVRGHVELRVRAASMLMTGAKARIDMNEKRAMVEANLFGQKVALTVGVRPPMLHGELSALGKKGIFYLAGNSRFGGPQLKIVGPGDGSAGSLLVNGRADVLGVRGSVHLSVDDSGVSFDLEGRVFDFDLLQARVQVESKGQLAKMKSLRARAAVTTAGRDKLQQSIGGMLQKFVDAIKKAVAVAKRMLSNARHTIEMIKRNLDRVYRATLATVRRLKEEAERAYQRVKAFIKKFDVGGILEDEEESPVMDEVSYAKELGLGLDSAYAATARDARMACKVREYAGGACTGEESEDVEETGTGPSRAEAEMHAATHYHLPAMRDAFDEALKHTRAMRRAKYTQHVELMADSGERLAVLKHLNAFGQTKRAGAVSDEQKEALARLVSVDEETRSKWLLEVADEEGERWGAVGRWVRRTVRKVVRKVKETLDPREIYKKARRVGGAIIKVLKRLGGPLWREFRNWVRARVRDLESAKNRFLARAQRKAEEAARTAHKMATGAAVLAQRKIIDGLQRKIEETLKKTFALPVIALRKFEFEGVLEGIANTAVGFRTGVDISMGDRLWQYQQIFRVRLRHLAKDVFHVAHLIFNDVMKAVRGDRSMFRKRKEAYDSCSKDLDCLGFVCASNRATSKSRVCLPEGGFAAGSSCHPQQGHHCVRGTRCLPSPHSKGEYRCAKADMRPCTNNAMCESARCVWRSEARKAKVCRPKAGFRTGSECMRSSDCERGAVCHAETGEAAKCIQAGKRWFNALFDGDEVALSHGGLFFVVGESGVVKQDAEGRMEPQSMVRVRVHKAAENQVCLVAASGKVLALHKGLELRTSESECGAQGTVVEVRRVGVQHVGLRSTSTGRWLQNNHAGVMMGDGRDHLHPANTLRVHRRTVDLRHGQRVRLRSLLAKTALAGARALRVRMVGHSSKRFVLVDEKTGGVVRAGAKGEMAATGGAPSEASVMEAEVVSPSSVRLSLGHGARNVRVAGGKYVAEAAKNGGDAESVLEMTVLASPTTLMRRCASAHEGRKLGNKWTTAATGSTGTVALWFRPTARVDKGTLVARCGVHIHQRGSEVQLAPGCSTGHLSPKKFHHLAVVIGPRGTRGYVNGKEVCSAKTNIGAQALGCFSPWVMGGSGRGVVAGLQVYAGQELTRGALHDLMDVEPACGSLGGVSQVLTPRGESARPGRPLHVRTAIDWSAYTSEGFTFEAEVQFSGRTLSGQAILAGGRGVPHFYVRHGKLGYDVPGHSSATMFAYAVPWGKRVQLTLQVTQTKAVLFVDGARVAVAALRQRSASTAVSRPFLGSAGTSGTSWKWHGSVSHARLMLGAAVPHAHWPLVAKALKRGGYVRVTRTGYPWRGFGARGFTLSALVDVAEARGDSQSVFGGDCGTLEVYTTAAMQLYVDVRCRGVRLVTRARLSAHTRAHIVLTYASGTLRVFVDGEPVGEKEVGDLGKLMYNSHYLVVGAGNERGQGRWKGGVVSSDIQTGVHAPMRPLCGQRKTWNEVDSTALWHDQRGFTITASVKTGNTMRGWQTVVSGGCGQVFMGTREGRLVAGINCGAIQDLGVALQARRTYTLSFVFDRAAQRMAVFVDGGRMAGAWVKGTKLLELPRDARDVIFGSEGGGASPWGGVLRRVCVRQGMEVPVRQWEYNAEQRVTDWVRRTHVALDTLASSPSGYTLHMTLKSVSAGKHTLMHGATCDTLDVHVVGNALELTKRCRRPGVRIENGVRALSQRKTIVLTYAHGMAQVYVGGHKQAAVFLGDGWARLRADATEVLHPWVEQVRVSTGVHPPHKQDCRASHWKPVGECNKACGGGVQRMVRTVIVPAVGAGKGCGALVRNEVCNKKPCPVDCKMGEWATQKCSRSCGKGELISTRRILVEAAHGGRACGETEKREPCQVSVCVPWQLGTSVATGKFHRVAKALDVDTYFGGVEGFTVTVRVRTGFSHDVSKGTQMVFSGTSCGMPQMGIEQGTLAFGLTCSDMVSSGVDVRGSTVYRVTIVYQNGVAELFLDGRSEARFSVSTLGLARTGTLVVGASNTQGAHAWSGKVLDVHFADGKHSPADTMVVLKAGMGSVQMSKYVGTEYGFTAEVDVTPRGMVGRAVSVLGGPCGTLALGVNAEGVWEAGVACKQMKSSGARVAWDQRVLVTLVYKDHTLYVYVNDQLRYTSVLSEKFVTSTYRPSVSSQVHSGQVWRGVFSPPLGSAWKLDERVKSGSPTRTPQVDTHSLATSVYGMTVQMTLTLPKDKASYTKEQAMIVVAAEKCGNLLVQMRRGVMEFGSTCGTVRALKGMDMGKLLSLHGARVSVDLVYYGGHVTAYVNRQRVGTTVLNLRLGDTSRFTIGGGEAYLKGALFQGDVEEFAVFARALEPGNARGAWFVKKGSALKHRHVQNNVALLLRGLNTLQGWSIVADVTVPSKLHGEQFLLSGPGCVFPHFLLLNGVWRVSDGKSDAALFEGVPVPAGKRVLVQVDAFGGQVTLALNGRVLWRKTSGFSPKPWACDKSIVVGGVRRTSGSDTQAFGGTIHSLWLGGALRAHVPQKEKWTVRKALKKAGMYRNLKVKSALETAVSSVYGWTMSVRIESGACKGDAVQTIVGVPGCAMGVLVALRGNRVLVGNGCAGGAPSEVPHLRLLPDTTHTVTLRGFGGAVDVELDGNSERVQRVHVDVRGWRGTTLLLGAGADSGAHRFSGQVDRVHMEARYRYVRKQKSHVDVPRVAAGKSLRVALHGKLRKGLTYTFVVRMGNEEKAKEKLFGGACGSLVGGFVRGKPYVSVACKEKEVGNVMHGMAGKLAAKTVAKVDVVHGGQRVYWFVNGWLMDEGTLPEGSAAHHAGETVTVGGQFSGVVEEGRVSRGMIVPKESRRLAWSPVGVQTLQGKAWDALRAILRSKVGFGMTFTLSLRDGGQPAWQVLLAGPCKSLMVALRRGELVVGTQCGAVHATGVHPKKNTRMTLTYDAAANEWTVYVDHRRAGNTFATPKGLSMSSMTQADRVVLGSSLEGNSERFLGTLHSVEIQEGSSTTVENSVLASGASVVTDTARLTRSLGGWSMEATVVADAKEGIASVVRGEECGAVQLGVLDNEYVLGLQCGAESDLVRLGVYARAGVQESLAVHVKVPQSKKHATVTSFLNGRKMRTVDNVAVKRVVATPHTFQLGKVEVKSAATQVELFAGVRRAPAWTGVTLGKKLSHGEHAVMAMPSWESMRKAGNGAVTFHAHFVKSSDGGWNTLMSLPCKGLAVGIYAHTLRVFTQCKSAPEVLHAHLPNIIAFELDVVVKDDVARVFVNGAQLGGSIQLQGLNEASAGLDKIAFGSNVKGEERFRGGDIFAASLGSGEQIPLPPLTALRVTEPIGARERVEYRNVRLGARFAPEGATIEMQLAGMHAESGVTKGRQMLLEDPSGVLPRVYLQDGQLMVGSEAMRWKVDGETVTLKVVLSKPTARVHVFANARHVHGSPLNLRALVPGTLARVYVGSDAFRGRIQSLAVRSGVETMEAHVQKELSTSGTRSTRVTGVGARFTVSAEVSGEGTFVESKGLRVRASSHGHVCVRGARESESCTREPVMTGRAWLDVLVDGAQQTAAVYVNDELRESVSVGVKSPLEDAQVSTGKAVLRAYVSSGLVVPLRVSWSEWTLHEGTVRSDGGVVRSATGGKTDGWVSTKTLLASKLGMSVSMDVRTGEQVTRKTGYLLQYSRGCGGLYVSVEKEGEVVMGLSCKKESRVSLGFVLQPLARYRMVFSYRDGATRVFVNEQLVGVVKGTLAAGSASSSGDVQIGHSLNGKVTWVRVSGGERAETVKEHTEYALMESNSKAGAIREWAKKVDMHALASATYGFSVEAYVTVGDGSEAWEVFLGGECGSPLIGMRTMGGGRHELRVGVQCDSQQTPHTGTVLLYGGRYHLQVSFYAGKYCFRLQGKFVACRAVKFDSRKHVRVVAGAGYANGRETWHGVVHMLRMYPYVRAFEVQRALVPGSKAESLLERFGARPVGFVLRARVRGGEAVRIVGSEGMPYMESGPTEAPGLSVGVRGGGRVATHLVVPKGVEAVVEAVLFGNTLTMRMSGVDVTKTPQKLEFAAPSSGWLDAAKVAGVSQVQLSAGVTGGGERFVHLKGAKTAAVMEKRRTALSVAEVCGSDEGFTVVADVRMPMRSHRWQSVGSFDCNSPMFGVYNMDVRFGVQCKRMVSTGVTMRPGTRAELRAVWYARTGLLLVLVNGDEVYRRVEKDFGAWVRQHKGRDAVVGAGHLDGRELFHGHVYSLTYARGVVLSPVWPNQKLEAVRTLDSLVDARFGSELEVDVTVRDIAAASKTWSLMKESPVDLTVSKEGMWAVRVAGKTIASRAPVLANTRVTLSLSVSQSKVVLEMDGAHSSVLDLAQTLDATRARVKASGANEAVQVHSATWRAGVSYVREQAGDAGERGATATWTGLRGEKSWPVPGCNGKAGQLQLVAAAPVRVDALYGAGGDVVVYMDGREALRCKGKAPKEAKVGLRVPAEGPGAELGGANVDTVEWDAVRKQGVTVSVDVTTGASVKGKANLVAYGCGGAMVAMHDGAVVVGIACGKVATTDVQLRTKSRYELSVVFAGGKAHVFVNGVRRGVSDVELTGKAALSAVTVGSAGVHVNKASLWSGVHTPVLVADARASAYGETVESDLKWSGAETIVSKGALGVRVNAGGQVLVNGAAVKDVRLVKGARVQLRIAGSTVAQKAWAQVNGHDVGSAVAWKGGKEETNAASGASVWPGVQLKTHGNGFALAKGLDTSGLFKAARDAVSMKGLVLEYGFTVDVKVKTGRAFGVAGWESLFTLGGCGGPFMGFYRGHMAVGMQCGQRTKGQYVMTGVTLKKQAEYTLRVVYVPSEGSKGVMSVEVDGKQVGAWPVAFSEKASVGKATVVIGAGHVDGQERWSGQVEEFVVREGAVHA